MTKEQIDRVGKEYSRRWKEIALGDIIDIKHGYAFSGMHITELPTSNILVTPGNFHIGGGFKSSKYKYYNSDFPSDYILKPNDIVVTMTDLSQETDTLGYSAKIPKHDGINYLHNQRIGLVQFKSNDVDRDFIYWVLRTKEYQGFIVGCASGTSIMHTAPTRIKEYSFSLPPLPEQTTIASILGSLDDKIDLLHRQNKTLEQLAETLFRQWFVEEAEEDWEVGKIDDIAVFSNGKSRPNDVENGEIPIYGGNGILGFTNQSNYDGLSIIIGRVGAYCGSLYIENKPIWLSDNALIARGKKEDYTFYLFYLLKSLELNSMAEGSSHPLLTQTLLKSIDISVPPSQKVLNFNEQVSVFWNNIYTNQTQIRTLTHTRDTLLPKLMSGEVRVEI